MKLLRRGTAIDERANFLRSKLLKSRVWDALCECEEEIAKHRISRTKSCGDYLLARPAPDAFAPSWLYLSSETSNLCPLINPLFLPYSWFRTPTLWLFLELWEVRSHLCLQRGPAAFKGRRGVLTTPCSLPIPQAPPFPICSGALVSKKKKKNTKERNLFFLLDVCFLCFPCELHELRKSTHTHSLSLSFMFFPCKVEWTRQLPVQIRVCETWTFLPSFPPHLLFFLLISPQYINQQPPSRAQDEALSCS